MTVEELIEELQSYIEAYNEPPYGREIVGTKELLVETVSLLQEYEAIGTVEELKSLKEKLEKEEHIDFLESF